MSEAQDQIRSALAKLDTKNDDHWTENGAPRLDALGLKDLKRVDVTAAAPLFSRSNTTLELAAPKPEPVAALPQPTLDEDYDKLSALCTDAEAKLVEANQMVAEAKKEAEALGVKRDALLKRLDKARPKTENMDGIRAVLERGKQNRLEKAAIATQLREAGVTEMLLRKGSPLDTAMARRRGLGLNRPTMQAVGAK